jgi:Peptidase family S41
MRLGRAICVMFMAGGLTTSAAAQFPSWGVDSFHTPLDAHWAIVTARDVDAAYALLRDSHPGGAVELHDLDFQHRLALGHRVALARARTVTSYPGYMAVLAGFATAMGDKHIWSRPTFVVNTPRWPRFMVSKRGETWIVTDADPPETPLVGAVLISCDGQPVDSLARKNVGGFRANWEIGAQQAQFAPWLLVDESNPFIARPKTCVADTNGQRQTITLNWMRIRRETLLPRLKKAGGAGQAGYGIRQVGNGYWIAIQDLYTAQAIEVVKAVEQQKAALRSAPFVVLDVRGNGGGSSLVGREMAASLFGAPYVDARLASGASNECGNPDGAWRVSQSNINNLQYLLGTADFVSQGGPEVRQTVETTLHNLRDALAHGRAFSGLTHCAQTAAKPIGAATAPSEMKGSLLLLTDNLCFSACLSLTDDFRELGAFHIGQTTDAATHYVDVREQYLPSGYSIFSTLQSLDPAAPVQVGPFKPALMYNGDIGDTAALEKWVVDSAVKVSAR